MSTILWAFFLCLNFMKKLLVLIICLSGIAFSQFNAHVIKFEYDRHLEGEQGEKALAYHENYTFSYILVHEPVVQRIRMQADKLLYFYPKSNIAIFMNNPDGIIATQPVQLFVSGGTTDLGFSDMGLKMTDYLMRSDTLIKTWELQGKNKDEYVRIDVFSQNNHVFKTISYDAGDKIIKIVSLGHWINISNHYFPLNIKILENGRIDEYDFSNVELLKELPDSIPILFDLPDDCEIHEYKF